MEETKILDVHAEPINSRGFTLLSTGTRLQQGKYKIECVLGQGGFGITYMAIQTSLNKKVAIKEFFFKEYCERDAVGTLRISNPSNNGMVERFRQKFEKEARTISQLNHPNIVSIHDTFSENGTAYYVMDYIEGQSLEDMVRRNGALSESVAIDYIKQVASALDYIHQRSINHLDVKPANIMVCSSDNKAILIDFGVSKQYDVYGGQTSTTPIGISHGYAPIEQYQQRGVQTFSPQTDIYSLGATLYKMLSGKTPPQPGDILNDGLTPLSNSVSFATRNAISKAMIVKKSDRPHNIEDFLSYLSYSYREVTDNTDKKTSSYGITLLIIFIVLGIVLFFVFKSQSNQPVNDSDENITEVSPQPIIDSFENITEVSPQPISDSFENISRKKGDFSVDIQWPTALVGVNDIAKVQKVILNYIYNGSCTDINDCANKILADIEDSYANCSISLKFQQRLGNLYVFDYHVNYYTGGNGGGAALDRSYYLYYNNQNGHILDKSDMFTNEYKILELLNHKISIGINNGDYHTLAESVPDEIYLSVSGLTFVFPTYSIGYGYQGQIEITLTNKEMANYLTNTYKNAIGLP